jgi:hypothetical protein
MDMIYNNIQDVIEKKTSEKLISEVSQIHQRNLIAIKSNVAKIATKSG